MKESFRIICLFGILSESLWESHEKLSLSAIAMVLERVKSKNLFNFRPQGFVDEDIEVYENEKRALRAKQGDCFFFNFSSKKE